MVDLFHFDRKAATSTLLHFCLSQHLFSCSPWQLRSWVSAVAVLQIRKVGYLCAFLGLESLLTELFPSIASADCKQAPHTRSPGSS